MMKDTNYTVVKEFLLLGFANLHNFQSVLFCLVLLAFIICIFGNVTIISLIKMECTLHKPIYFFISIFATLELIFITVTIPKFLAILIQRKKAITFIGCCAQLYAFNALGETECFLLSSMVFDRYLAINNPLRYSAIMNHKLCSVLAVFPWLAGFFVSFFPTMSTAVMEFCGPNEIDHFFCDLAPLQNLACSDPYKSNLLTVIAALLSTVLPFITIIILYIHIIFTVLKIQSREGKMKAFSTCSSHLIVVCLFYGTVIAVYIRPNGSHYDKYLAIMYTVVTPLLNPFIYALRNREVKHALIKLLWQHLKLRK
ncbi:olfactory receptor 10A7-like [Hyperolius riggenbachi]|uniref:olfactory receptor 10A7-like n=1 Tax=Hyperolius riggenbachi TaxID=752182 RepID=UPI0035A35A04